VEGVLKAAEGQLRTREDFRRYLAEVYENHPANTRATQLWHTAKQGMWLLLLVLAYLQYYLLNILIQIDSMPGIRFPPL
jgi:hypothetical protein